MFDSAARLTRRQALIAGGGALGAAGAALTIPRPVLAAAGSLAKPAGSSGSGGSIDWSKVEQAMHAQGQLEGGVFVFDLDRTNLNHVTIDNGIPVQPAWALDNEFRFLPIGNDRVFMSGEATLLEHEVQGAVDIIERGGGLITALHNHLILIEPHTQYMHWKAIGDPVAIGKLGYELNTYLNLPLPQGPMNVPKTRDVDLAQSVFGEDAMMMDTSVFEFDFPRPEKITVDGYTMPPEMAVQTMIMFEGIGHGQYAVMGEFCLVASEATRVSEALRDNGCWVTAFHHHEIAEDPQLYFMHGFGYGDVVEVAKRFKAALDQQAYTTS